VLRLQGGEGYWKCVWDRWWQLEPDLYVAKEWQTRVHSSLVKPMRAVLG
jgi:hypothetical protein